jgi:hypothetical protein
MSCGLLQFNFALADGQERDTQCVVQFELVLTITMRKTD